MSNSIKLYPTLFSIEGEKCFLGGILLPAAPLVTGLFPSMLQHLRPVLKTKRFGEHTGKCSFWVAG